jgi:hypothetical protein
MANFCIECGRKLEPDWNVCPDCGKRVMKDLSDISSPQYSIQAPIQYQPSTIMKQEKAPIEKVSEKSWIFYLVAGVLSLIALFTPTGVYQYTYFGIVVESWNMWMYGYNVWYVYSEGTMSFWTDMPVPHLLSIITTLIIVFMIILIIVNALKLRNAEVKASKLLLGCGIILILTAIAYLIVFHIYTLSYSGDSIWTLMAPGFGLIGQFISGILIIIGFVIAKRTPIPF